jgi:DNA-binding transcriptional regulator GbsR (MarR family)
VTSGYPNDMVRKGKRLLPACLQVEEEFVQTFTFFCSRLGISRTAAEVLAVIFMATGCGLTVSADDISQTLSVARSTLSGALAELESAGLIMSSTESGSRRLLYQSYKDAWEFYRAVLRRRELLEIDRTLQMIRSARAKMEQKKHAKSAVVQARNFEDLMGRLYTWLERISVLSADDLRQYVSNAGIQLQGTIK